MFDLRLISADVLKLRRRRGMLALAAAVTIGVIALAFTVMTIQHSGNPAKYGPAGGLTNYKGATDVLLILTMVAATIVGSTAGAQDIESGVFRDLAATGRSRVALLGSRVVGAWVVLLPIVAAAAALVAGASLALAGGTATPGAGAIIAGTAAVLTAGAVGAAVAVGLCTLVGSRGPVIAIMLAFNLALAPLLAKMSFLGDVRDALPTVALARVAHTTDTVHIGLALALGVLATWIVAAFAAGAWRTQTREI
jgi:ABC-type transport system involved in multi-copper enzyme maturation permease subunit